MFLFVCQASLWLATWRLDISVAHSELLMMFLWLVICGMTAIAIDRRLAPAAVSYLLALCFAVNYPEHRLYAMSAANFIFTIAAVWSWRPATIRYSDEERAQRGLPPRPRA